MDRLRWRPVHTRVTLALGVGWLLDSFEVNVIGGVLGVLQKLWRVSAVEASLLVTAWLAGIMTGALLFGYLADRFGRRKLFLLTLLLYSSFTVVSAVSPGYYWFLAFRFLTAVGVGAEYSAVNAAIGELIPARYRGRASAGVMSFWPLGAILAAGVSYVFINLLPPTVGWRFAFALGGIIALFTVWARKVLPESPRWLWQKGRAAEAARVAHEIEAGASDFDNPAPSPADEIRAPESGFFAQLGALMRNHPGRLALGSLLDFSEASGYYGIFAFLPLVVLPRVHVADADVPLFFLWGNVGALAGGLAATILLDRAGRKFTVTLFYTLAALSVLAMAYATGTGDHRAVMFSFVVANFCATGSWVSAYPTFSELFPTRLRSTGIGFSVAFGRIGAAIAPPLLTYVAGRASAAAAFGVLAAFWALGALVMIPWCLWGTEGKGRPLEAVSSEVVA